MVLVSVRPTKHELKVGKKERNSSINVTRKARGPAVTSPGSLQVSVPDHSATCQTKSLEHDNTGKPSDPAA